MHFQKLELQLSNALGFRLGDLLPVEALVFYVFFCAQLYYYTWWWCGWLMKSSSRYNLVHLLPTSSSKSAPRPTVLLTFSSGNWALATVSRTFCRSAPTIFLRFVCEIELSLRSCAFCRPHLPKVLRDRQFFTIVELSLQSCALFVYHFPRSSRAPAETETLLRRPRQPVYQKKIQGFAPESVFKPELTRSRSLTLPNYLHVFAMMIEVMMWWPSWWES